MSLLSRRVASCFLAELSLMALTRNVFAFFVALRLAGNLMLVSEALPLFKVLMRGDD